MREEIGAASPYWAQRAVERVEPKSDRHYNMPMFKRKTHHAQPSPALACAQTLIMPKRSRSHCEAANLS